jgi:choline monooxygenase
MNVANLGLRFHQEPERAYNLEGFHYYDPAIYRAEQQGIFSRDWIFVCHGELLRQPGCYTTATIAEESICVIRGRDGVLRAFYNVCQHRGHELLSGSGRKPVINCPYHAWAYDLDGHLVKARNTEDLIDFDLAEFNLTPVGVEEYCGFVFVNLDPAAAPLAGQAGGLERELRAYVPDVEALTFAHRIRFEVAGNWKNAVDNFLECYHCDVAHPAFAELVDLPSYRSETYGIYSSHIGRGGPAENAAYKFEADGAAGDFAAWWLWPYVTFNVFPGGDGLVVFTMEPDGVERTIENFDFYFRSKEITPQQQAAIDYTKKVLGPEDVSLVESVQRGLRSRGFRQGRYVVDRARSRISEHALHHFHALVLKALAG